MSILRPPRTAFGTSSRVAMRFPRHLSARAGSNTPSSVFRCQENAMLISPLCSRRRRSQEPRHAVFQVQRSSSIMIGSCGGPDQYPTDLDTSRPPSKAPHHPAMKRLISPPRRPKTDHRGPESPRQFRRCPVCSARTGRRSQVTSAALAATTVVASSSSNASRERRTASRRRLVRDLAQASMARSKRLTCTGSATPRG